MNMARPGSRLKRPSRKRSTPALARLAVRRLEDRTTPSTLISVTGPRDLVFDSTRNALYITTSTGSVARYDVASGTLLPAVAVGTSLNGADITPDGHYLYVAENQRGPTQGFFYKIDLTAPTPTSTLVPYNLGFGEGGAWDIAIGPSGTALTTTRYEGSGWVDSRLLDTSTDTFTPAGRTVTQDTHLHRSADRSLVFVAESNISSGPMETYRFGTGFSPQKSYNWYFDSIRSAVNRDGTLIASEVEVSTISNNLSVVDPSFNAVQVLSGLDGGMAFDPTRDILYAVNSALDQIVALDTNTWRELYRMPVEQNVSTSGALGPGVMTVSGDGTKLFLVTSTGVRRYDLPVGTGSASRGVISNIGQFRSTGFPAAFTLTVTDPAGNVVPGFTGTVSFTSTDPAAVLPAPYTFTAADAGSHTFAVTWNTAGTRTVTATAGAPFSFAATSPSVVVTTGPVSLIPLTTRRDLVYDDAHGLLLITTSAGTVERYDPVTRSVIAPLTGGASYNGADILPDGSALYVAEGQRSLTQSLVRRIDLVTGATTLLQHNNTSLDGGAWDIALAGNGTGIVDYRFEGSGWVNLDRLNVAAGTLTTTGRTVRQSSNVSRGAGRNLMVVTESNISSGPIFTYDPVAGTFPSSASTSAFLDNNLTAVNRDGTRIALEFGTGTTIMNATLGTVTTLAGIDGGMAFDPVKDVLYGVNSSTDTLLAYDTNTWAVKYYQPVGENMPTSSAFGSGVMTVSGDGRLLFLSTPTGVRIYQVGETLSMTVASSVTTGRPLSVTVAANTPAGIDSYYRGTVTLSGSLAALGLPASYTFAASDFGSHVFNITPNAVGPLTLTATDNQSTVPATAAVNVLPAKVADTQANPGQAQRSRVTSIQVTFNTVVTYTDPLAAFTISRNGGGSVGTFSASAGTIGGATVVTLTAFGGAETDNSSLADGVYKVTVHGDQVFAGGAQLDGDASGTPGGDYALAGTQANGLFRLFGDATGNGVVDLNDLAVLRGTFNVAAPDPAFVDYLDADRNGVVDLNDLGEFRRRFNVSLFP